MKKELEKKNVDETISIQEILKNVFGENVILIDKKNHLSKLEEFFKNTKLQRIVFVIAHADNYYKIYELSKKKNDNGLVAIFYSKYEYRKDNDAFKTIFLNFSEDDDESKIEKGLFGVYSVKTEKFYSLSYESNNEFGYHSWFEKDYYPDYYVLFSNHDDLCKSFRKKLILFIEKYLPNKETVEYSYFETFGEEIKINDNFIYQKAKKYLIDNTTPQINDYLDGFFEDSEIKNSDLIYEMEFSEKYIQTYFEEYKSKYAVYTAIETYFLVKEKLEKEPLTLNLNEFLKSKIIKATHSIDSKTVKLKIIFRADNFPSYASAEYKEKNIGTFFEATYDRDYLASENKFYLSEYRLSKYTKAIKDGYSSPKRVGINDLKIEDIVSISFRNKEIYSLKEATEEYDFYISSKA